jgi:hypothetical protein
MKVKIRAFTGMRPVVAPDLLRPGEAVTATNTLLTGGDLAPYNAPLQTIALTSGTPLQTIYKYGQLNSSETDFWFQSTNDVNFVKGPVDGDTEERTYFTGHLAYPAKTKADLATTSPPYPTTSYPLGIHKPASALTTTVTGTATDPDSVAETVVYVTVFVTSWGEVSSPSEPSAPVSFRAGQSIELTNIPQSGTPSYPGNSSKGVPLVVGKRIYRSATGSSGSARYLLVNTEGDIALATTTYSDTKSTANLGESLLSRYWVEPPDGMVGLTQMANGVLAGFTGNTLCFSEPFVPYAWPVRYQQSTDAPIVGCAAFDQSLLVATKRSLYVITGTDPASMTSERLAVSQTCASKRGMVEMGGGVVFPTPDGLMFLGSGTAQMITDGLMSRREWQAYVPSSMHAYESDGRYLCFYDTGSTQGALVFTLGEEASFCLVNQYATTGFRDRSRDALYLCFNGSGTTRNVMKWDAGAAPLTLSWLSGVFKLPGAMNFGVARVDSDESVQFELLGDGAVVYGPVATPGYTPFRLPGGYRSRKYQVRVSGASVVRSIEIASDMTELVNGE